MSIPGIPSRRIWWLGRPLRSSILSPGTQGPRHTPSGALPFPAPTSSWTRPASPGRPSPGAQGPAPLPQQAPRGRRSGRPEPGTRRSRLRSFARPIPACLARPAHLRPGRLGALLGCGLWLQLLGRRRRLLVPVAKVFLRAGPDAGRAPQQRNQQQQKQPRRRCSAAPPGRGRHPARPPSQPRTGAARGSAGDGKLRPWSPEAARPSRLAAAQTLARTMREVGETGKRLRPGQALVRGRRLDSSVLPRPPHDSSNCLSAALPQLLPGPALGPGGLPLARRPPRRRDVSGRLRCGSRAPPIGPASPGRYPAPAAFPPPASPFPRIAPPTQDSTATTYASYWASGPNIQTRLSLLLAFLSCQISPSASSYVAVLPHLAGFRPSPQILSATVLRTYYREYS
jgi:hypothetical protein